MREESHVSPLGIQAWLIARVGPFAIVRAVNVMAPRSMRPGCHASRGAYPLQMAAAFVAGQPDKRALPSSGA
jgi:hypothetical protein